MMAKDIKHFVNLPPEEWALWADNDTPISNFTPEILEQIDVYTEGNPEPAFFVRIQLCFADGQKGRSLLVTEPELQVIIWTKIDPRCRINPKLPRVKEFLYHYIQQALRDSPHTKTYHCSSLGLHEFEGSIFYRAGDKLIVSANDSDTLNVQLEPHSHRLDIDTNRYPEPVAIEGMMRLISLCPKAGQIAFAHALSGLLRAAYLAAGVAPCAVIQVVGESGMLKSTFIPLLVQLYNRGSTIEPATRLNSTTAFIEGVLHDNCDCTIVLDDLHPASARSIVRQNEATLEEIIRRIGDNQGRGHMEGRQLAERSPRCNVIALCQYAFGGDSTAARSLVVDISEPINSGELDRCQDEPLLASTFYFHFIQWFVDNYAEIVNHLTEWRHESRSFTIDVHRRLKSTHFCLSTAYLFFMQYCVEKMFVTAEDAESLYQDFNTLLTTLIREQNIRYEHSRHRETDTNTLRTISAKYHAGRLNIAENIGAFTEQHDGLINAECLCIRSSVLQRLFPRLRLIDITSDLISQGALKCSSSGRSIQISGSGGKRFYAIPLIMLQ